MTIKTLKDLEKAMQLCAKHGVRSLKIGNIEMSIELPTAADAPASAGAETSLVDEPQYSPEDMLMWSAPDQEA